MKIYASCPVGARHSSLGRWRRGFLIFHDAAYCMVIRGMPRPYILALLLLFLLAACALPNTAPPPGTSLSTRNAISASPAPTPLPPYTPTSTPTPTPTPLVTPPADGIPQVTLHIALNYADKRMAVTQRVLLANPGPDTWSEVVFAVPPAHQPGVFLMEKAEVTTAWDTRRVKTTLEGTMLRVACPVPVEPGAAVAVDLEYTLFIPPVDADTWLPSGNLGAGERVLQAGDWHPTLAPYVPGTGWQTWDYVLVGDPNVYAVADYDVTLRADPAVVIAAPGLATRSAQARRFRLDRARAFAFLASPEYQMVAGTAGATPVRVYFLPDYGVEAEAVLSTAAQVIPLYEELYGPYPYKGLVIAQNAYYGAMEYSGLISMSSRAFDSYQETPIAALINLTTHEIAHQWWYGAVGNDQVREPWLDESFAKYSEVLFYERYYPDFVEWWWRHHIHNRNSGGAVDATIYDFADTLTYIDQVYAQGAKFLADLRALMGDPDFFAFVRAYREANDGRIVTRDDFFDAVHAHTDTDLTALLDTYFPEKEHGD